MLNFEIRKSSRRCAADQQEFQPGEVFYSALMETGDGETERFDYCRQHWVVPESDCIGWWKSRAPEADEGKIYWAPREVMLSYFEHLLKQADHADLAYVTGLVLIQKRILGLVDDQPETETLRLFDRTHKTEYSVPVCEVDPERISVLQEELAQRLFVDQPAEESIDDEQPSGDDDDSA